LTVVVFKRNDIVNSKERNVWNLIGKYHSHYLPIRDILFGTAASDSNAPRFFSLGEDQELVEYDLTHRLYREHILLRYSWKLHQRCMQFNRFE